jgi:RNA polymerase sigma factor (sigma-70 family)
VAALYDQHAAMVLAICRRLLRDSGEAEDAAQQTFLSAQRALQNGSPPREPAAWLATIARNECVARTRARMREPFPTDAEPATSGVDTYAEAVRRENVESLREAIGSLPDQQREAILLREVRGLSYDEVAASLALTPSAVESLLFRARKGLQLRLRNAWAALSPVGWLATVRELSTQVAAGGDPGVGPVAAKAVVLGLGTAVIAGGALVGPSALHRGRPHATSAIATPGPATIGHRAARTPANVPVATPRAAAPVAKPEPPSVASVALRSGPTQMPAAAHAGDGHEDGNPVPERSPGEDRKPSAISRARTTEREDTGARPALAPRYGSGVSSAAGSDSGSVSGSDSVPRSDSGSAPGGDAREARSLAGDGESVPASPPDTTASLGGTFAAPPTSNESGGSDTPPSSDAAPARGHESGD